MTMAGANAGACFQVVLGGKIPPTLERPIDHSYGMPEQRRQQNNAETNVKREAWP